MDVTLRAALRAMALAVLLCGCAAHAAEIRYLGANNSDIDRQLVDPTLPCNLSLTGPIEKGDAERLAPLLANARPGDRDYQEIDLLCLDTPGGSFAEALRIVSLVRDGPVATRLLPGARCESACALIFMAGGFNAHESGLYKWRVMHPTARLGFHAPSLIVEDGIYDRESVTRSYEVALKTVADTASQLMQAGRSKDGDFLKGSLRALMLSAPAGSMAYVETVDQAGRWDIDIGPLQPMPLTDPLVKTACLNMEAWRRDNSAIYEERRYQLEASVERVQNDGQSVLSFTVNQMDAEGCEFFIEDGLERTDQIYNVRMMGGSILSVDTLDFHDPSTRLVDLPVRAPDVGKGQSPVQASGDKAPEATGRCTVRSGTGLIDDEPCRVEEMEVRGAPVTRFLWPSGARTVLEKRRDGWYFNGSRTSSPSNRQGGGICASNPATGRLFCYAPNG